MADEANRQVLPTAMGFAAKEAIAALRDRRIENRSTAAAEPVWWSTISRWRKPTATPQATG